MGARARRPFVAYGFRTTHEALQAESILKGAGLSVVPIPTPSVLGELCGIAMRVPPEQAEAAEKALLAGGVSPEASTTIEDF